ncbi:2-hydroxyacylsphingosine 1-beta-galactosyltransferase-like [Hyposmocoma kahamanoa]|uniref:2-hydroxyacylsphingosine 1-beta-galactosyltransferase-like n=1 Tax=Hyposmocoma kahamanoa TaxID=1477025 RepID=UPI000E6D99CA|nr:2-hydroxyacylsphingosine 1-beta-galactosyltransferase-like [Hyposmocoma kahamanoa]
MRSFVFYLVALFALLSDVQPARILGLFPHTGRSHQMVFEPLLNKLAERGHDVHVVSFFPLKNPPANYTDYSLEGISQLGLESVNLALFENPNPVMKLLGLDTLLFKVFAFWPLNEFAINTCMKSMDWPAAKEAFSQQYDLIIVEYFTSDCMVGLAHVYGIKAPIVAVSSSDLLPWVPDRLGLNDNPAYVPQLTTYFTTKMNFFNRMENTLLSVYYKYWFRRMIQEKEQEIIEKHFGRRIPDLHDLAKNLSLIIVNTHYTVNGVRPSLPGVIEAGGMHLDHTRKPIPHYIERFLNESKEGVVLLSFGSLIKTATLPKYKEQMIVNAMSKLKQRVLWKYENSGEEGTLTGNILRVKWIPQYELLQHPKVLAFVAHGGLLGMTEAISAGKPMVVMPFFGDQPTNGAAAQEVGLAKVVPYAELSEKALFEALQDVLSAEMRVAARRISEMWKDRPTKPLDTAVYWTERVIRWGHQSPLHSSARDMTFIQKSLLDVAAAFMIIVIVLLFVFKFLLSLVPRLLTSGGKQKLH